jgi:3-oxoacyl-[acyl-carrier-protein] synthase-1
MNSPLVLSSLCVASALGAGQAETWDAIRAGRSALSPCTFDSLPIAAFAGAVPALDDAALAGKWAAFDCRNNRLAELALQQDGFEEAVAQARARYGASRIGLFTGTSTSGILQTEQAYRAIEAIGVLPADFDYDRTHNTYALGRYVRARLGLAGPSFTISTACAATAKVFAAAARMIAAGLCDAAVVGGADSFCATTLFGFHALGVMAEGPCRPFDAGRRGISVGEAAGFALLERAGPEPGRDGLMLLGVGESSDAYHMSSPDPEGSGAYAAMRAALDQSGLDPAEIDYINLHGTATLVGDAAEDKAVSSLFGTSVPRSSSKGFMGHTLGAAGIVGATVASLAIRHGFLPGSPHTRQLDRAFAEGHVLAGRSARVDRVMCNAFGFGGVNCSFVLGRAGTPA